MDSGLSVVDAGRHDAPALVLLHGLIDSNRSWGTSLARWSADYRVIAPDALGHGRSRRLTDDERALDNPMEALVAATVGLLRDLGDPVLLLGHSMGGGMASAIAARHPELVRALVLEDPAWRDRSEEDDGRRSAEWRATVRDARDDRAGTVARLRAEGAPWGWGDDEFDAMIDAWALADEGFLAGGRATVDDPWEAMVAALEVPTLVLAPSRDAILDAAKLARLAAIGNPLVTVATVADSGHSIRRDNPAGFHAIVDPFLAAHAR